MEFWPGVMILFALSFGPTFIALTVPLVYTVNSRQINHVNEGVLGVFLVFCIINFFSIQMLNRVYS